MKAKTIIVGNFKGGVGKTKIATMLGFVSAKLKNKRTLLIDLDPQANATQNLAKTGNIPHIKYTITNALILQDKTMTECITPIMENLDLIACDTSFTQFPKFLYKNYKTEKEQTNVLKNALEPLKDQYDYIFLDVPPTISDFSDNAMVASDYSLIAFQTQEESLVGVQKYIAYQNFLAEKNNMNLQVAGIIACLLKPDSQIDNEVMFEAKELYKEFVLKTVVTYQERLKRYSRTGIELKETIHGHYDQWDFKACNVFFNILSEIETNISYFEKSEV